MCAGNVACSSCMAEHGNDINALQVCKTKCRAGDGYELGKHVYKMNPKGFREAFERQGVPVSATSDIDKQIEVLNALGVTGKDKTGLLINQGEPVVFDYMNTIKNIPYAILR